MSDAVGSQSSLRHPQRHQKRLAVRRWRMLRHRRKYHPQLKEVDAQHRSYTTLSAVQNGIRTRINCVAGSKDKHDTQDYRFVDEVPHRTLDGELLLFRNYAPGAFATVRQMTGIKEDNFLMSMAGSGQSYVEFDSNSRSGSDFYISHDMRYILKTIQKKDAMFLLSILGDYIQHLCVYPHSLLTRCVGCYSVIQKGKREKYFLAMLSIFYPTDRIEERFDVKGSTIFRYQKPKKFGSSDHLVLKDQNFLHDAIELGPYRDWFLRQISADSAFLRDRDIMDYSLLIGRQVLHADEKYSSFPDLVARLQKSVPRHCCARTCANGLHAQNGSALKLDVSMPITSLTLNSSPEKRSLPETNTFNEEIWQRRTELTDNGESFQHLPGSVVEDVPTVAASHSLNGFCTSHPVNGFCTSHPVNGFCTSHPVNGFCTCSLEERVNNFLQERRRLLPCCDNALHVIDGLKHRYFLGIVDILKDWKRVPKVTQLFRFCYCWGEHSTMPPGYYSRRFINFISNRTT